MAAPEKSGPPDEPHQPNMLVDVLLYPLRRGGLLMLAIGAGTAILLSVGSMAPVIGVLAAFFSAGFFATFYLDIIGNTVNGSDDLPDWPDLTHFYQDLGRPFVQTMGVTLISIAPYLLTHLIAVTHPARQLCQVVGLAFFVFYFPMGTLGLVMHGHLGGALPHRVLPAIFRAFPGYLLVVFIFGGLTVLSTLIDALAAIPLLGGAAAAVPSLYLLMAQGRLIGLLYRSKREELGWG